MNTLEKTISGIDKYLSIMGKVLATDLSMDEDFQHLFNGFYQVRRNKEWRDIFYSFMENNKNNALSINDVLLYLNENTLEHRVELSFSSKLLHTIEPDYPIYDKNVATLLDITPPKPYWNVTRKIEKSLENYEQIIKWYHSNNSIPYLHKFDELFPQYGNKIGNTKKIDFILWRNLL